MEMQRHFDRLIEIAEEHAEAELTIPESERLMAEIADLQSRIEGLFDKKVESQGYPENAAMSRERFMEHLLAATAFAAAAVDPRDRGAFRPTQVMEYLRQYALLATSEFESRTMAQ